MSSLPQRLLIFARFWATVLIFHGVIPSLAHAENSLIITQFRTTQQSVMAKIPKWIANGTLLITPTEWESLQAKVAQLQVATAPAVYLTPGDPNTEVTVVNDRREISVVIGERRWHSPENTGAALEFIVLHELVDVSGLGDADFSRTGGVRVAALREWESERRNFSAFLQEFEEYIHVHYTPTYLGQPVADGVDRALRERPAYRKCHDHKHLPACLRLIFAANHTLKKIGGTKSAFHHRITENNRIMIERLKHVTESSRQRWQDQFTEWRGQALFTYDQTFRRVNQIFARPGGQYDAELTDYCRGIKGLGAYAACMMDFEYRIFPTLSAPILATENQRVTQDFAQVRTVIEGSERPPEL